MKKIGFVAPWYGETIPGGAEMELRGLIHHLREANVDLEVLTTCVKDFMSNWNQDYYKAKTYRENGITVRRFPVTKGNHSVFNKINAKLLNDLPVTRYEETLFIKNIVKSDQLCQYISEHSDEYSLFVFIPYMFGTTYHGILACPEKAVVIPCLHDENYAYMSCYRECFSKACGMIFHAKPECTLAKKLIDLSDCKQAVLGEGVDTDLLGVPERFRKKYKMERPFILYAGRKDQTKNVHVLVKYFEAYKKRNRNSLQLVMVGPSKVPIPNDIKADVHDLGFVSTQDKYDAYAAAAVLCQPSKNESFSLVIMESWLAHRPVMVHEECRVTTNFVKEANGGFYFQNYSDFEGELNYLLNHPEEASQMGEQGREYVKKNFSWDVVVKRYLDFFKLCAGES